METAISTRWLFPCFLNNRQQDSVVVLSGDSLEQNLHSSRLAVAHLQIFLREVLIIHVQ